MQYNRMLAFNMCRCGSSRAEHLFCVWKQAFPDGGNRSDLRMKHVSMFVYMGTPYLVLLMSTLCNFVF